MTEDKQPKRWYKSPWFQGPVFGVFAVLMLVLAVNARTNKSAEAVMLTIMGIAAVTGLAFIGVVMWRDTRWRTCSSRVHDFDTASRANFEERERIYTDKNADFRAIITLENGQQFLTTSNVAHLRTRPLVTYELRIPVFGSRQYRNIHIASTINEGN